MLVNGKIEFFHNSNVNLYIQTALRSNIFIYEVLGDAAPSVLTHCPLIKRNNSSPTIITLYTPHTVAGTFERIFTGRGGGGHFPKELP